MNQDDRDTNPHLQSPYEHILSELITIRQLCETRRSWQLMHIAATGLTMLMAITALVK